MNNSAAIAERKKQFAVTERGKRVHWTEEEVDAILKLLVANGGKATITCDQLRGEGINMERDALEAWRDHSFPHRYMALRTEMSPDVAERVAGNAMERALQADEAEQAYIEEAQAKVKQVDPNHLAKNALALAQAKGQNIEKAQLLRDRPTEIVRVDLAESIAVLERLGVVEKNEVIDAEVIEEEDG
jgi:hypothetical protein